MTQEILTSRRDLLVGAAATAVLATTRASARDTSRDDELTRLSIAEASRRIAARTLSPVELTQAYLARIESVDRRVNSFITVTAGRALEQARALEAELARGEPRSPLHGIPIGLKDNIDTAGVLTTAASAVYANRIPTEDAECVRRLRGAGAVFLGKLNMHEFAFGGTCVVSNDGPVRNPWNLEFTPGGSSGGSAAAVAARLCAASLGTDTAASIRLPAAYCGVTGFKATHGLASIRGIVPLSEMHDHVGPLARSVADCALVMNALQGFDARDPVSIQGAQQDMFAAVGADVSRLRIGVVGAPFFENLDPEIAAAIDAALATLKSMTRGLADLPLPAVDSFAVLGAEIYAYHAPLLADRARRELYQPQTLARIMGGAKVSSTDYIEARRRMSIARNTVDALFSEVDVLVAPTAMRMPFTVDEAVAAARANASDFELIRNTLPFNTYGVPAISVPCGFTRAGLPIGLQIVAPRFREASVLALAHAYQQATSWQRREPPIA
jgi:aspartyl-tRNA(Asn)/glutamyl-tRNA(Gln) amidotransferase subunit A